MRNLYTLKTYIPCLLIALTLVGCDSDQTVSSKDTTTGSQSSLSVAPDDDGSNTTESTTSAKSTPKLPDSAFQVIDWVDLIPEDDLDALVNPPSYITDVEEGSIEDQVSNQLQAAFEPPKKDRYQQALVSTTVIEAMDNKPVRIPGFVVPLEFDDNQTITQFFLVPFFGACIHVPPPPPNQIIFVNYPTGFQIDALYDPLWISGVLSTSLIENDVATAAYTIEMQSFKPYVGEE